jgi:tetratricopeptide (TPR) repeat protein
LSGVIQSNPRKAHPFSDREFEHYPQKSYDLAAADYSKYIEFNKYEHTNFHNRGMVHLAKDDPDSAIVDFKEAVRLNPSSSRAFFGLSDAYRRKGMKAQTSMKTAAVSD